MKNNEYIEIINQILAKWNPLEVPPNIAKIEYSTYADPIYKIGRNPIALREYLVRLVRDEMGLNYDDSNLSHRMDIEDVLSKIVSPKLSDSGNCDRNKDIFNIIDLINGLISSMIKSKWTIVISQYSSLCKKWQSCC